METANTNEALAATAPPTPPSGRPDKPRKTTSRWLILLIVLAALGAGGWFGYQWLQQKMEARSAREALLERLAGELPPLRAQVERLAHDAAEQTQVAQKNAADIAALNTRLEQTGAAVSRLADTVQGGRVRVQLAAIEQLLLLANDRALLAHDAAGAAEALAQADERIGALNEPRLFKVREAITQERSALAVVPKFDLTAAALALSNMLERLPQWTLQGQLPERLTAATTLAVPPEEGTWLERFWLSIKQALRATFLVRRDDRAARLLPPEQQALIIQVGQLKLEGARLALLRGNTAAFRSLCDGASTWLHDYFRPEDPGVQAAQTELQHLRTLELSPNLPDISRSLGLLRAYLSAPAP